MSSSPSSAPTPNLATAIEQQWKVYAVINEWIRSADTKAGLMLTADGVLAGVTITLPDSQRALIESSTFAIWDVRFAVIGFLISIICCLLCILPKVKIKAPPIRSLLFFQEIAGFPDAGGYSTAAKALGNEEEALKQISAQVWAVARVAKGKHNLIAGAVTSFGFGLVCVLLLMLAVTKF